MVPTSPLTVVRGPAACNAPFSSWVVEKEEEGGPWVSNSPRTVGEG
jgi:hypothetical protein